MSINSITTKTTTMGFQIKNEKGEAFTMGELDEQVCKFWGIEVREKSYGSPIKVIDKPESFATPEEEAEWKKNDRELRSRRIVCNWFDQIGLVIDGGADTWDEVKKRYSEPYENALKEYENTPEYEEAKDYLLNQPPVSSFVALIEHFRSLGYTPIPVKG